MTRQFAKRRVEDGAAFGFDVAAQIPQQGFLPGVLFALQLLLFVVGHRRQESTAATLHPQGCGGTTAASKVAEQHATIAVPFGSFARGGVGLGGGFSRTAATAGPFGGALSLLLHYRRGGGLLLQRLENFTMSRTVRLRSLGDSAATTQGLKGIVRMRRAVLLLVLQ